MTTTTRLAVVLWSALASATAQQAEAKAAPLLVNVTGACTGVAKDGPPVRVSLWLHDYRAEGSQLVRDARADAAGAFAFPAVPWLSGHDWGWSFFVLFARQGDRVGMLQLRGDTAASLPVAIALAKGITVRGTVRNDVGAPLAEARVHVAGLRRDGEPPRGQMVFFAEPVPAWATTTRADGTFTIDHVLPDWTLSIQAVHDQYVSTRVDATADQALEFALAPAALISGRVLHADGKPAVRVRVCAQGARDAHGWTTARTNDDGEDRLTGLPAAQYNIWAEAEDLTVVAIDSQPTTAGAETKVDDLVLIPGGLVVGRVIDVDTGKPVQPGSGADVAMYGPARPRSGAGCECSPIGADGTFRLRVAPGDSYVYLRQGEGWEPREGGSFDLTVAQGQTVVIEFKVRRHQRK